MIGPEEKMDNLVREEADKIARDLIVNRYKRLLSCTTWTSERPNQEGWYWLLQRKHAEVVEVRRCPISGMLFVWGLELDAYQNNLWAGPIPLPVEP